jgi:hypothetical protein
MTHYTDEDLILHYYGEGRRRPEVESHLDTCAACMALYSSIRDTLQLVPDTDIPERDDSYALEVWQRIRSRLPEHRAPWWHAWFEWSPVTAAVAVVALVLVAFVAGRTWPSRAPAASTTAPPIDSNESGDRVRLAAIGDHLERSEGVLLDVINAGGHTVDLTDQQRWAADLIDANRLYRDAAASAGDARIANVLDDLERSLLDVVHGPSRPTPAQFEDIRTRVDAAGLVLTVRILADELHERETAPVPTRKTT